MKSLSLTILCLLLGGLPAAATPPPVGPDFQVNVPYLGAQLSPDVARRGLAGGFVVAWVDDGASIYRSAVKLRLYRSSGEPEGGEREVASGFLKSLSEPRVAVAPDGRITVIWTLDSGTTRTVYLRRFDREGTPLGEAVPLSGPSLYMVGGPDLAVDARGDALVVWEGKDALAADFFRVFFRRVGRDGEAAGDPLPLSGKLLSRGNARPRLAVNPAGAVLASWDDDGALFTRRLAGPDASWSPETRIAPPQEAHYGGAVPLLYPEGDGALVFIQRLNQEVSVAALRLDASGAASGQAPRILGPLVTFDYPDAALDPMGNALVAWTAHPSFGEVEVRLFDRSWDPLGASVRTHPEPYERAIYDYEPAVAALGPGRFAVVWTNDGYYEGVMEPLGPPPGRDDSEAGVFGQVFGSTRCVPGGEVLCLGDDGRFEARVAWKTPAGQTGAGHAAPLTPDTGALWFFDDANLELMVKVLDARAVNGYFWVFYGSLSNLEYTLTIKDTVTEVEKTYRNAPRQLASRADVEAFPVIEPTAAAGKAAGVPVQAPVPSPLLLAGDRFRVEVAFTDPRTGLSGLGRAVPLTGDTGAFWFFEAANLELMIKVLDGRASNGHFWVFFGALSDVDYTVTVTDTVTGAHRTYHNDRHTLASRADVNAF